MVAGLLAMLAVAAPAALPAPREVIVATARGEVRIQVRTDPAVGPVLAAGPLLAALRGTSSSDGVWASIQLGDEPFRFLLGAPLFVRADRVYPLAAPARARRDTLYLPLQFVSEALPRLQAQHFSYDPATARLTDRRAAVAAAPEAAPAGRHRAHRVAIDPGHGGVDPGNPGLYFPAGLREKDVNLAVGLLLRDLLQSRGVEVVMTRTRDTLIDLRHRGRYCSEDCALFVSLHVNSLPRRRGYTSVRGFETYFLAEARTEDAARVARMENEAIRFETPDPETAGLAGLDFILKDLMVNEYLRESGRMASLIQAHVGRVHSGDNRGVKQAGLMVLTTARRPAVLFEMGFSTNRQDARLMTDTASQRKLATALADAIVEYLREYERRTDADSATNRDGLDGR